MSSTSWLSTPSTPGNTSTNLRRDHFPASSAALSSPSSPQTPANMSSTSWLSTPSTPGNTSTNLRRGHFPASPDLSVTDEASLASYLSNYRAWESTLPSPVQEDAASQVVGSATLWRPHSTLSQSG